MLRGVVFKKKDIIPWYFLKKIAKFIRKNCSTENLRTTAYENLDQYGHISTWRHIVGRRHLFPPFQTTPLLSFLPLLKNYWSPFPIRPWTVRHPDVFWTYHFLNVNVSIIQWHMKPHHGAGWGPKYFIFDAFEEVYLCLLKRFFCWSILRPFYLVFT